MYAHLVVGEGLPSAKVFRTRPLVLGVVLIHDQIIGGLPTRGSYVHSFPRLQLDSRADDVYMPCTVALAMPYGIVGVLIAL